MLKLARHHEERLYSTAPITQREYTYVLKYCFYGQHKLILAANQMGFLVYKYP